MTLLVAANGLCLFVLWRAFAQPSGAPGRAATQALLDGPEDGAPEARVAQRRSPAGALSMLLASPAPARTRDHALEERLREVVAKALENARERSKGKVGPGTAHVAVHVREAGRSLVDFMRKHAAKKKA